MEAAGEDEFMGGAELDLAQLAREEYSATNNGVPRPLSPRLPSLSPACKREGGSLHPAPLPYLSPKTPDPPAPNQEKEKEPDARGAAILICSTLPTKLDMASAVTISSVSAQAALVSKPRNHGSTSFSGLKASSSSISFESGTSFLGKTASLRASGTPRIVPKAKSGSQISPQASYKVAVLGAAGGIGQPLGLLIKMSPLVSELRLYDIANVKGVAADLSHCNTPAQVMDFTGPAELAECLKGVDVVVIPAGVPRKPGMTRDDLFNINAGIVKSLIEAVADNCPEAFIHIISNPVNSTVPIAAEILKQKGVYNPKKLFGVSTLDVVRANTFVAQKKNLSLIDVDVPVVGGHAGITILPLLSKTRPSVSFTDEETEQLTKRIQNAGTEVVEAKAGAGSATLSMAYAAARFVESSLRAMAGDPDVYECTYVQSELTELPFFASRVKLGKDGVESIISSDLEGVTEYEAKALEALKAELKASIEKGIEFAHKQQGAAASV
ncbi:hypothetical protein QYE76_031430 [Lolium multiflorum]|uniref:malate dehydrogenase n=1 Tax=Lolium multiflorum TaxID=4521 RepID=A0AAD8VHF5_LOLMU|nr:hypothetical protein QYE76_031430 [Lolium multiflorum]